VDIWGIVGEIFMVESEEECRSEEEDVVCEILNDEGFPPP
jgi:hypothetical protein